ncbi:hypothetical protein [Rhizobium sp. MHM7A]|uniref:hypothetical protein n=1 Tax=Rhizobium sp. MHM7A TaxID=2583233 RepID=UPI001106EDBA|nr:hypothetical protein [Rhizobium sp. MHM7A]TLX17131.1 hypothetical protein FFR93_07420 [Rhizobium sp. MHM7A]
MTTLAEQTTPGEDWAARAAGLILKDLRKRKGIGNALDDVDDDVLLEIQATIAEIARNALGSEQPSERPEPPAEVSEPKTTKLDGRIPKAIQVFSEATSEPSDEFELKDAFVDLVEGVMAHNGNQIFILAQPTGELEVRARIERKVHNLYTSGNHDALSALCATIVAAGRDRVPYLPSRPFESIITKTSIDQHGLRFPDKLKTIHALIEPLTKGMFIDLRLHCETAGTSLVSQAAEGDTA